MKTLSTWLACLYARARLPTLTTPAACLRRLARMHPSYFAQLDPVRWAQQCLEQAKTVIEPRRRDGCVSPGDAQAIGIYENAVAVGFYQLEHGNSFGTLEPVEGSAWSKAQLLRIRQLGIEHGRLIRGEAFRHDVPVQTTPSPRPKAIDPRRGITS